MSCFYGICLNVSETVWWGKSHVWWVHRHYQSTCLLWHLPIIDYQSYTDASCGLFSIWIDSQEQCGHCWGESALTSLILDSFKHNKTKLTLAAVNLSVPFLFSFFVVVVTETQFSFCCCITMSHSVCPLPICLPLLLTFHSPHMSPHCGQVFAWKWSSCSMSSIQRSETFHTKSPAD